MSEPSIFSPKSAEMFVDDLQHGIGSMAWRNPMTRDAQHRLYGEALATRLKAVRLLLASEARRRKEVK